MLIQWECIPRQVNVRFLNDILVYHSQKFKLPLATTQSPNLPTKREPRVSIPRIALPNALFCIQGLDVNKVFVVMFDFLSFPYESESLKSQDHAVTILNKIPIIQCLETIDTDLRTDSFGVRCLRLRSVCPKCSSWPSTKQTSRSKICKGRWRWVLNSTLFLKQMMNWADRQHQLFQGSQ